MNKKSNLAVTPYFVWIILFVVLPIILIGYQSFIGIDGKFTLTNYQQFFSNGVFIKMTLSSFWYAFVITFFSLLVSFPTAYIISKTKYQQFWLLLIILPTWINLLLKAYAFIGIFAKHGMVNNFLGFFGVGPQELLFTNLAFIFVATYIEIPFMVLPIYNAVSEIDPALIRAGKDLGANSKQIFTKIIWPLALPGVYAGVQAVFIPSLSLFMLTRLIAGNRVITLGTAIEEYFLTTMNWGMGSMIGVFLIIAMIVIMSLSNRTKQKRHGGMIREKI